MESKTISPSRKVVHASTSTTVVKKRPSSRGRRKTRAKAHSHSRKRKNKDKKPRKNSRKPVFRKESPHRSQSLISKKKLSDKIWSITDDISESNSTNSETQSSVVLDVEVKSGSKIDELLHRWHQAKTQQLELKTRLEQYKLLAGQIMDKNGVDILSSPDYTLRRRDMTQSRILKRDVPGYVWDQYARNCTYPVYYLSKK